MPQSNLASGDHLRPDAQGFSVTSTFDPLDRLVKNRDPRNGLTQFGHDPAGNMTVLVDAALNTRGALTQTPP